MAADKRAKSGWRRPKKKRAPQGAPPVPPSARPLDHIEKRDVGRPTKYKPDCLPYVKRMARAGFTEFDIQQALDVSLRTMLYWKSEHPEFLRALEVPKGVKVKRVVRALFHKALGYTYESEKVFCNSDGEVTRVSVIEHVPPAEGAIKLLLNNLDPDHWKDRRVLEHKNADDEPFKTEDVTPPPPVKLLDAYLKRMARAAGQRTDPGADSDLGRDGRPGAGPPGKS